jgi:biotin synthase
MTRDEVLTLAERIADGHETSPAEAIALASDDTALADLMAGAAVLVQSFAGGEVEFCSIVNARSGRCPGDCAFCAQSTRYDTGAPVYGLLDADAIVAAAHAAAASGAARFGIVTSGPAVDDEADFERICEAVQRVAALGTLGVCASLGTLTPEAVRRLKAAGLTRYHHNLETSEAFYPRICTTQSYAAKLDTLHAARDAGLELCSGGIFGLGETWRDRIDMAMTLREIGVDSLPVNFLVPIPGTPLQARDRLTAAEALRIIALCRFILPRTAIKVCGGREAILDERQPELFSAGATGAMLGNYLTTPGRPPDEDLAMVAVLGLTVRSHAPAQEHV